MASCDRRGPLTRAGHAQPDRQLVERDPAYFELDERDVGDLILFGRRFAAHMIYYNPDNVAAGDWSAFFENDVSAILASLAKAPVDPFRNALLDVQKFLEAEPGRPAAELESHFSLLFHLPLTLYREVAARQSALDTNHPLRPVLQEHGARDIGPALAALASYHQGAVGAGLIGAATALDPLDYTTATSPGPGPRISDQVAGFAFTGEAFETMSLAPRSIAPFAPGGWAAYYTAQPADAAPYADAATPYGQIYDALNYNLLVSAIERVFQAMARTRREAETRLRESLEDFAGHTPHYGLWLAFLAMFDKARAELNDFTGRHLDFYYEEVLRLARRGPVADNVHLLVELAKGRDAHLLPAGTEVRAGKDDLGREVAYATDEDFVANRAQVAELRAVRLDEYTVAGKARLTVRAAPMAASADGQGADLPEDAPHFAPFGPAEGPFARVGFAVSDPQLFMREGERTIKLHFPISVAGAKNNLPGLRARLSTEDGWFELEQSPAFRTSYSGGEMRLRIKLDGGDPAVVHVDPEVHGTDYPPGAPVLEVVANFEGDEDKAAKTLAAFWSATRGAPTLETIARGLRLISVKTDDGVADPAAEFMPFGARPKAGSRWIIGSTEAFSRPLNRLKIRTEWAERHTNSTFFRKRNSNDYRVAFEYLKDGVWTSTSTETAGLKIAASAADPRIRARGIEGAGAEAAQAVEEPAFEAGSRNGFVRMTLDSDFGHGEHLDVKTLRLIGNAKDPVVAATAAQKNAYNLSTDGSELPLDPYTPETKALSIEYRSVETPVARVFRLHPFGVEPADGAGRLFPALDYAGALFIGVDALDPPERLSLLTQVADGTGDPLLEAPALSHAWLGDAGWTPFVNQEVDDRTENLAGSGLIAFAMPQSASTTGGIMPSGLHWIRVTAPANAAAVNRLLSVDAQAVRAAFVDRRNDPTFLETPLPAETIAKLKVPDPAVKGLAQPYASFGGRGREDRAAHHRRASERLRHKDRAVTMWDHEHLALEAFPAIYRVKALNHTELVRQAGKVVGDNELAPGAVTIIAVPYTEGREHLNPLRPYTDRATLTGLKTHLGKRCSPFVRLETENPKFEEVHVEMNVAFLPGIADTDFYRGEIEAALIERLTPWLRRGPSGAAFGGLLYKSTVIDFVEELPYVDYLEDVRMFHRPDPDVAAWTKVDAEIVRTKTARSILVSAPAHTIGLV